MRYRMQGSHGEHCGGPIVVGNLLELTWMSVGLPLQSARSSVDSKKHMVITVLSSGLLTQLIQSSAVLAQSLLMSQCE
jgi:hypothetical protein